MSLHRFPDALDQIDNISGDAPHVLGERVRAAFATRRHWAVELDKIGVPAMVQALSGAVAAAVTPLGDEGNSVDVEAAQRLVQWYADAGWTVLWRWAQLVRAFCCRFPSAVASPRPLSRRQTRGCEWRSTVERKPRRTRCPWPSMRQSTARTRWLSSDRLLRARRERIVGSLHRRGERL